MDPDIVDALNIGLQSWRPGLTHTIQPPEALHAAVSQHDNIGLNLLIEGWCALDWESIQDA
jgi:hypothetical protein